MISKMDVTGMERWCRATLVFILAQIIGCHGYPHKSTSACFNNSKEIRLECDRGYMVRIKQTFYGYSYTGQCKFTKDDCKFTEKEQYPCMGRQWCVINLPSGPKGKVVPGCNKKRSTYIQADYECIKASDVVDICAPTEITSQTAFIKSPNYPWNYPKNQTCSITLRGRPNQKWVIHTLDVHLSVPINNSTCEDKLYIGDKGNLCGNRWKDTFPSYTPNGDVVLRFTSGNTAKKKGFWLYAEANPLLPTPEPPTTISTTTQRQEEDTTKPSVGGQKNSSQKTSDGSRNIVKEKTGSGLPYPAAAIIGGVIGGLLFILAILVILLIIKRYRENKQFASSRSDLSTKRKTSNTQNIQIQNNMGVCNSQSDNSSSYVPSNNPCHAAPCEGIRLDNMNSQNNCSNGSLDSLVIITGPAAC